jgi:hypothetical protein
MKRLLLILVFVSFTACATTTPPVSHNTEMTTEEAQSEKAKKLGKNTFWMLIDSLIISHALQVWPF